MGIAVSVLATHEARFKTEIFTRSSPPLSTESQAGIVADLVAAMPTYGVADYFRTKPALLGAQEVTVLARETANGRCIGIAVADWCTGQSTRFLHIKTVLIGETWHRGPALAAMWRALFMGLLANGSPFPPVIVIKTYNPKSFSAMRAFAGVIDTVIYPALEGESFPEVLMPAVRDIAAELAPGRRLDERSGVIEGAAEGVAGFYRTLPLCGKKKVDRHFQAHLTPDDRLLGCLFALSPRAGQRILKAFGVPRKMVDTRREPSGLGQ
ncbi:hypothetical protein PMI42_03104 [Bradyrhizobium sp. YR681]|uniref:hypothetical protein n=1 Tax=Bradyrhizobium sp. YR681 TaxID=1144344 RepID=UPI0002711BB5|nr:hypothetical protein [Bradyrhizobium sp. YR681]EJN13531.1 hypothetical protein PMI42_03104 [Bradyrhizobium sp. YR681]